MGSKLNNLVLLVVFGLVFAPSFLPQSANAVGCKLSLEWYKDDKPVYQVKEIGKGDTYLLWLDVTAGCVGKYYLKQTTDKPDGITDIDIDEFSSTGFSHGWKYKWNGNDLGKWKETVQLSNNQGFNRLIDPAMQEKSVSFEFVKGVSKPVNVTGGSGSGGDTGATPADIPPAQPGAKGLPANEINTKIKYTDVQNFDKNLGNLFNPLGSNTDSVPKIIAQAIRILLAVVAGLTVIIIIVAGFRMVLSSGNESEVKSAKQALTWAVIGLAVSLLSFSLVSLVQRVI